MGFVLFGLIVGIFAPVRAASPPLGDGVQAVAVADSLGPSSADSVATAGADSLATAPVDSLVPAKAGGSAPAGSPPPAASDSTGVSLERDPLTLKREIAKYGALEVEGLRAWERRKSAQVALFSNMVLPGLGQLYNGRRIKTVIMVGVATFYTQKIMTENRRKVRRRTIRDRYEPGSDEWKLEELYVNYHREVARDYMWYAGAAWLIGVLDAYIDAHLYDVRGIETTLFRHPNGDTFLGLAAQF